jgi:hypothetical protein
MYILKDSLIQVPQTISTSWVSEPLDISRILHYSLQIGFLSANATVTLQASNDLNVRGFENASISNVQNWTTIDGSSELAVGDGTGIYDVENVGYHWVRIVVNGSMTLNSARIIGKGV